MTHGRYLSPEPLLQSPSYVRLMSQNGLAVPTYAYANNNPVRHSDPTGLSIICNVCVNKTFTIKNERGIGASSQGALRPGECKEVDGIYRDDTFKPDSEEAKCGDGEKPYVFKFRDPGKFDLDCDGNLSTNNPFTATGRLLGAGWKSRQWASSNNWPIP